MPKKKKKSFPSIELLSRVHEMSRLRVNGTSTIPFDVITIKHSVRTSRNSGKNFTFFFLSSGNNKVPTLGLISHAMFDIQWSRQGKFLIILRNRLLKFIHLLENVA